MMLEDLGWTKESLAAYRARTDALIRNLDANYALIRRVKARRDAAPDGESTDHRLKDA